MAFGRESRFLTITRKQLLAHVWSGPYGHFTHKTESPWPSHFKHSHWWRKRSWSKFASHYAWGADGVRECKMDGKIYMVSYMASSGSCFVVTWTILKNYCLEVGRTQNRETMAFRILTTVGLFYFIMCEDPHESKFIEIAFGWGPGHEWLHTTLEGLWPHYMILEVCWDGIWTLSFGLSQFHGHCFWLVCEVALPWCLCGGSQSIHDCNMQRPSCEPCDCLG